jgi:hypothetical protein
MSSELQQEPIAKLRADIAFLLGDTLGADPFRSERPRSPILIGFAGLSLLQCFSADCRGSHSIR